MKERRKKKRKGTEVSGRVNMICAKWKWKNRSQIFEKEEVVKKLKI